MRILRGNVTHFHSKGVKQDGLDKNRSDQPSVYGLKSSPYSTCFENESKNFNTYPIRVNLTRSA